jgi:ADP-ribose pyrophosphatase
MLKRGRWEFAQRTRASAVVGIVATTSEEELILVEQFRVPLNTNVIELPAGLVGDEVGAENEDLLCAAKRELDEETGYSGGVWSFLSRGPSSSGLTDELISLVEARGVVKRGPGGGVAGENITIHVVKIADLPSWLRTRESSGQLVDPKVYAALWFATQR